MDEMCSLMRRDVYFQLKDVYFNCGDVLFLSGGRQIDSGYSTLSKTVVTSRHPNI